MPMNDVLKTLASEQLKTDLPEVRPGDTVRLSVRVVEGKFWLVNLKPDEGPFAGFGEAGNGGVIALYQKCPHLGCTVPWRATFDFEGKTGWFRCPCHGSTYSRDEADVVFGPAPRPLDTLPVRIKNGRVWVTVSAGSERHRQEGETAAPARV